MGPENGINLNEVPYFKIEDYIKKIHLKDDLLEHMEYTNQDFTEYFNKIKNYSDYAVMTWFISMFNQEMKYSQKIENSHFISPEKIKNENIFFDTLQMSHKRIKDLHKFVTNGTEDYNYRTNEIKVGCKLQDGSERIYWYGANPETIKQFMDDYITLYKKKSLSVLTTNPFLRSALMHLLFVRIHPFKDGNGRTARMIHNMCFTESINNYFGMKLKICPLNLSQSILLNQYTYADRINDIYFDLKHDCNDEINKWFDFILNMVDEQLYHWNIKLPSLEKNFETIDEMKDTDTSDLPQVAEKQLSKRKARK